MNRSDDLPVLTDVEKARWRAVQSEMRDLAPRIHRAQASDEEKQAAWGRLAALNIDNYTLMNALHVPADAGHYAVELERILRRIPDGWGRWINHGPGWYRLIVGCDERLAKVDPNYIVYRVREKHGMLRYYCAPSVELTFDVRQKFHDIVSDAEHGSRSTCECCGRNGVLHQREGWVKRLCDSCGVDLGFTCCVRV